MTKEELSQIYYLNRELKMWQRELERLNCESLIKSPSFDGMPKGSGGGSKVENMAVAKDNIITVIIGKQKEIELLRDKITEFITTIDDSLMRQIIYYRCVCCMRWEQVAIEIGGYNSAEGLRKMFQRFFEKK